jgi:hypothetical protein
MSALLAAIAELERDAERLDWYEQQHTLHGSLELLYVVDGYELSQMAEDGDTRVLQVYGESLRAAIDAARSGT